MNTPTDPHIEPRTASNRMSSPEFSAHKGAKRSTAPREVDAVNTRLLQCALAAEESRAYWLRISPGDASPTAQRVFEEFWFGAKSLPWVKVLLLNMRARFDAFPEALAVLHAWREMSPGTRAAICHWHLQLADPLYRAFAGDFLWTRQEMIRPGLHRRSVIAWVAEHGPTRWTLATRKQMASKLLSAAFAAGLVAERRDPRQPLFPSIDDDALEYLLYLLRDTEFEGSLTDNPYLRSVGLRGPVLDRRLRALPGLDFRRVGDVIEFGWRHADLRAWAVAKRRDGGEA